MSKSNSTILDKRDEYDPAQMAAEYFKSPPRADDEAAKALVELLLSVLRDSLQSGKLAVEVYLACVKALKATKRTLDFKCEADQQRYRPIGDCHAALVNALLRVLDPNEYAAREASRARYSRTAHATQPAEQGRQGSEQAEASQSSSRESLLKRLEDLGDDPTNEAARFKVETDLYRLDHQTDKEEWPELIDG